MHLRRVAGALVVLMACASCTTYRDQLARGQRAFELGEHDRTLALLRDLEPDVKRLTPPEQAQYAYLRGMADYRVGYKPDARHWLSIAKAYEDHSPGMLPPDWKSRTNEALDELNGVVYTAGTSALVTARVEDTEDRDASKDEANGRKKEPRDKRHAKEKPPRDGASDAADGSSEGEKEPATKASDPAAK